MPSQDLGVARRSVSLLAQPSLGRLRSLAPGRKGGRVGKRNLGSWQPRQGPRPCVRSHGAGCGGHVGESGRGPHARARRRHPQRHSNSPLWARPSRRCDAWSRTAVRARALLRAVVHRMRGWKEADIASVWSLHGHARCGAQTRGRSILGHRTRSHRPREVHAFAPRLQSTRSKVRVPVTGRTVLP